MAICNLGDRVRIIAPFMFKTNCQGIAFENLCGKITGIGFTPSMMDVYVVKFDDTNICGVAGYQGICDHDVLRRTNTITLSSGIITHERCQKIVTFKNVVKIDEETLEQLDLFLNDELTPSIVQPKNNEGREICYWCAKTTHKITGFNSFYDFCDYCKK